MDITSFPTRERGLKSGLSIVLGLTLFVVPHAGTWIEIITVALLICFSLSFPTRERGLKSYHSLLTEYQFPSFPTRERGLKYQLFHK